nr:MAG TPA: hypothetical protein [Bacteriophage sp.]
MFISPDPSLNCFSCIGNSIFYTSTVCPLAAETL